MKAIQAVKKMVALGMGLTMVGATIFGASAANLSDYPAPFVVNGTPASNLAVIVGDQADGADVIGAVDIIQSLQSMAVVKSAGAGTGPSQLVVEGDAVEIGSTSDLLEIGESLGNVRETLTEVDLDMLKGGQIVTDKGSTEYNQYLRLPINGSQPYHGAVIFAEDERDRVGHYLYLNDGDLVFQWELEFEEGLESEIEGDDLKDLEDEDITILGQPFVLVDSDVTVANLATLGGGSNITAGSRTSKLVLEMIGGAVSAVLGENDAQTFVVDGKEYEVEVLVISETSAGGEGSVKFRINGEITDELEDGETDVLADGTQIGIRDILATGKDIQKSIVQFYLGAYKVEFRDDNTADNVFQGAGTEVNEETIEDSAVRILGQFTQAGNSATTLDGTVFEVQNVQYNLTADAVLGDMYVPPGTGVREQLDEPEGMLTPNWDIRYEGLMDTGVTLVRIDSAGDDEYDLEFTNQEGIFFDFPLVSNESGNVFGNFKYGDDDDSMWFTEFNSNGSINVFTTAPQGGSGAGAFNYNIQDDDFFVVSNCDLATNDDTCFSHVLRFDSVDSTNRQLTFTDVGTGTREVTYGSANNVAQLVVGGITYAVAVNPADNATIVVDLNGDGTLGNNTRVIIGIQGEGLLALGCQRNPLATTNISVPGLDSGNGTCDPGTTSTGINVTLVTLAKEFDEATTNENITMEIIGVVPDTVNINRIFNESADFWSGLLELEENDDISQALSAYGVFFELFDNDNANDAEDLTIEYPLSQRGARVFVTGGVITTTTVEGGGVEKVQPIQIGAAKLASEVSDVSMYNAVVVGGPCANPIAASLLGNPEPCYESVPMNKAIVKLFEHTNGNVALLVNGRSALNTRQGARAVATGQIKSVAGMEAEVTGTTLADVTVRAVTQ
jgi:hypothetical protein